MANDTGMPTDGTGQRSRETINRDQDMGPGLDDAATGQHRTYGTGGPGEATGQSSKKMPNAFVGNKVGLGR